MRKAFIWGGLIAMPMPFLAGIIGIETLAKYGAAAQLASYQTLTRLAIDINPWIGGVALAAVLAAVVSSGGPILLSSATMFVRDWIRHRGVDAGAAAARLSLDDDHLRHGRRGDRVARSDHLDSRLAALRVRDGGAAGARGDLPLYWKRTTEAGAFWGMVLGFAGGPDLVRAHATSCLRAGASRSIRRSQPRSSR